MARNAFSFLLALFILQLIQAAPSINHDPLISNHDPFDNVQDDELAASWSVKDVHVRSKRQVNVNYCAQSAPGVNETAIFHSACIANPQNNYETCMDELRQWADSSAVAICQRFYTVWNGCMASTSNDANACSQQETSYASCTDYTLQAYAYCGCFYTLPDDISDCANIQLQIEEAIANNPSITANSLGPQSTLSGQAGGNPPATATVTVTFTPLVTPDVPLLTNTSSLLTASTETTDAISSSQPSNKASDQPGMGAPISQSTTSEFPMTVSSFTGTPGLTQIIASECSDASSIWDCMVTRTLYAPSAAVTGYVCLGGDCQNQLPGYRYCRREVNTMVVPVTSLLTKREL